MARNLDVVRASYAAFARGDLDEALAAFHPDVEWTHPDGMDDYGLGGAKKGLDEVRAHMARARTVFAEIRPEPRDFVESGDRVVAIGVHHMRGAHSGVAGTVPFVHTWQLREGRATHFRDYHDTAAVRRVLQPVPAGAPVALDGPGGLVQLGLGFWPSKVVLSAVELGVFTELARRPLPADELRDRLGLHERAAVDFFDTLVALGLLERDAGVYRNTLAAATFLDRERDTYVGGLLEIANELWWRSWGDLTTALRTGVAQNNARDTDRDPFDVLYADPERLRTFQKAMTGGSLGTITALAEEFPWERYRTVADVGCSEGALISRVLRRHPHLTGIGFDLPPVGPTFEETAAAFGLTDRMRFQPGNFFTDDLPGADVIVFGHVLHDWDLGTKRMLLGKAHDALPPGGAVVVYEALIDDERRHNTFGLLMSLHMLLESPGGFDYTGADCLGWMKETGFVDGFVEHLAGPESMVVAFKP